MPNVYLRNIIRVGNSSAVTLPKPWLRYHEIREGNKVELVTNGGIIIIRPITDQHVEVRKKEPKGL